MALKIEGLNKSFSSTVVLDSFSYTFPETGLVAIAGRSGVGKTTLLRIIAGLDTATSGEMIGGGIKNTSFAFQEYRLFSHLTALDNVLVASQHPKQDDEIKAASLLFRLGFTSSQLSLKPHELSGGMKQRVSIARAILKDAPILILDEPTKEMDEAPIRALYSLLKEISHDKLIIFTSHNPKDISVLAEKVINLQ